jgi:NAD(P)-dependent dehydrogenase (short-subunit alcohol dehydrogenase family)
MLLADEFNCSEPTRSWRDIHVNTVCTGAIRSPLFDNLSIKFAEENHCMS